MTPVPVPHDAREPTQFVFDGAGVRIGVLTDLGHVTPHVCEVYRRCNALLVEANHDRDMLWGGDVSAAAEAAHRERRWVISPTSRQWRCCDEIGSDALREVVVGHISEQNNCAQRLGDAFADVRARLPRLALRDAARRIRLDRSLARAVKKSVSSEEASL